MVKRDVSAAGVAVEDEGGPAKQLKISAGVSSEWSVTRGPQIIQIGSKSCSHEVAWPGRVEDDAAFHAPGKSGKAPAKTYPFSIDPFQQIAINCLEAGHSVLVAAHTSAGKTVVAEYAFAMALRDKQRVIYTSPLKALSNQKYREFFEEFGDVGLMTGDVTINPDASCLVMTTEILRQMLYNDSETVREAALVVYDEIHYLRDKERGVVWEESIVMMPKSVRFAFLSATIPNAAEFAQWIAKTHESPCHVVYTDFRPTPLQHYIFPSGGDGLYMVVDENSKFKGENFTKAVAAIQQAGEDENGQAKKEKGKKGAKPERKEEDSDIFKIVKMIMERRYDPVIVFSFSKRECEELAQQMVDIELNTPKEKKLVKGIFENAMDVLAQEDRNLAQINGVLPMLMRGIGIHHSGLLPIVKEVIEILFQEGLLKALFATETFSTGLNMPAKTVVFTNARKFDGAGFRWVTSGEYIQMSGRAGRRGKDDRGIVILMLDSKMEPAIARDMVKGAPDTLHSEFRLGYSMLLNIMRGEGRMKAKELLAASFKQFQVEQALPVLQKRIDSLQEKYDAWNIQHEAELKEYLEGMQNAAAVRSEIHALTHAYKQAVPFLQPGRLVELKSKIEGVSVEGEQGTEESIVDGPDGRPIFKKEQVVWGCIVNFERMGTQGKADTTEEDGGPARQPQWMIDVLVNCWPKIAPGKTYRKSFKLVPAGQEGSAQVVLLPLHQVTALSAVRIFIHKDLRPQENCDHGVQAIAEVQRRMAEVSLLTDKDLQIDRSTYKKAKKKLDKFEERLNSHSLASSSGLIAGLTEIQEKQALLQQVQIAKREARTAGSIILLDELKHRVRLLHRLEYLSDDMVTRKGRVAAEIQSADEIVLTELIFTSNIKEWSKDQIVALVSCFVWQERQDKGTKLRDKLVLPFREAQQTARRVAKVALDCKLDIDVEEYVASFRPELMEYAADWCQGARFMDIQRQSEFFEGSLVRAFRRMEEVLRQLVAGAKVIGDQALAEKFETAMESIKHGVVFAGSLYL